MRRSLEPPDPALAELYGWIRYHIGFSTIDGLPADGRRGKGIRSALCLAACAAAGGPEEDAEAAAAAIELTHEFSLIHDDLQDRDRLRRGRPALWTVVGEAHAIGAGDVLYSIARHVLSTMPGVDAEILRDVERRYDLACIRLSEGQYLDLTFEERGQIGVEAYLDMVERKTGALLGAAAGIGAGLGEADAETAESLESAGLAIGVAFQIRDDILGLWGSTGRTGKPAGNDLRRGKKSLPIVHALTDAETGRAIQRYWDAGAPEAETLPMLERLDAMGARGYAEREAERYVEMAMSAIDGLDLRPAGARRIADIAREAIGRDA